MLDTKNISIRKKIGYKRRKPMKDGTQRKDIHPGQRVNIILKKDQRTENLTQGVVKNLLTKSAVHSRGIKVRLEDGQVGRVREVLED